MNILIFQGAPDNVLTPTSAAGWRTNDTLFSEALGLHEPALKTFTLHVADGEHLPQGMALSDFDGVVITGSPLSVYDGVPGVTAQIELARQVYEAGIPTWGSCWGLQVMSAALGGDVRLNPKGREIGIARTIILNDRGRAHQMYEGKPAAFDAICSHQDEVAALPSGGTVLASNTVSEIQAAEIAEGEKCFWGVQYHPEMDLPFAAALIEKRAERHIKEKMARDAADVASVVADYRALGTDGVTRPDLVWRYGLQADVLEPKLRTAEFGRWIECKVKPHTAKRA